MKKKITNPLEVTSIPAQDLASIPGQIENLGGFRQNISNPLEGRADSLSDVINKIRSKGGSVAKLVNPSMKRALGLVPGVGAGMAAMSGDPAMAAEELAQDAMGPAGLAYEAIRPSDSGNPEEEKQMLAERNAMANYANSPANLDHLAKTREISKMGIGSPEWTQAVSDPKFIAGVPMEDEQNPNAAKFAKIRASLGVK